MEKLKSILADKIIELSEDGGDNVKLKIEKVHIFRNFAHACQTLIDRYPAIEDELIRMVNANDFDTKVASTRVDTVIRLAQTSEPTKTSDGHKLEEIKDKAIEEAHQVVENAKEIFTETVENVKDFFVEEPSETKEPEPQPEPEDVEYETLPLVEQEKEYAEFAEVTPEKEEPIKVETPTKAEPETKPVEPEVKHVETTPSHDGTGKKDQMKKILIGCGIIFVIILLYYIVVFVLKNLGTILWSLGGIALVAIIIWILVKRNKK